MAGRPLKYRTVTDLEKAVEAYFTDCDSQDRPYTASGLAYFLGMDRKRLIQYGARRHFSRVIRRARARIEASYEERLVTGRGSATGVYAALRNGFGWVDRHEQEITTGNARVSAEPMDLEEWLRTYGGQGEQAEDGSVH